MKLTTDILKKIINEETLTYFQRRDRNRAKQAKRQEAEWEKKMAAQDKADRDRQAWKKETPVRKIKYKKKEYQRENPCQACIDKCKRETSCGKPGNLFRNCKVCQTHCEEELKMSCADQATLDKLNRPTLSREEHEEFLKGFTTPAPLAR